MGSRSRDASIREVARVLAPGGPLVAITHVWAVEKHSPLEEWVSATSELFVAAGFGTLTHRTSPFHSGQGLVLRAEKRRPCNRKAP